MCRTRVVCRSINERIWIEFSGNSERGRGMFKEWDSVWFLSGAAHPQIQGTRGLSLAVLNGMSSTDMSSMSDCYVLL